MTARQRDSPRALIRYTLVSAAVTVALVWLLYLVRDTLLLIYVAGLIMALLIGGSLLGIVGAILAVPTAAILQVLLQELLVEATAV